MADLQLGPGMVVHVELPPLPSVTVGPPPSSTVAVVPVAGPAGPPGTPGPGIADLDDLADVDAPANQPGVLGRSPDGVVRPTSLDVFIAPHVVAPEPHPAYDDLPSLRLLFENGLI